MSSYSLALAHYRLQFPTLGSLGSGDPPADWKTEYDRVASSALGGLLLTSGSFEGGDASGVKNFDQATLLRALHARRHELDEDYVVFDSGRPMGITVLLGGARGAC